MKKIMQWDKVIRGVEVEVTAEEWDGDESLGMPYGPEVVYATAPDGQDFELTDQEIEALAIEASDREFHDRGYGSCEQEGE